MNLAIIPARSGSKRIPKKNIKIFDGKPVISYSIQAAIKSKKFKKIIVSTDSKDIAKISNKFGAETPFYRPKKISDDHSSTIDVVKHAISYFKNKNINFNNICCIYPVAPFVSHNDINKAFKILTYEKKLSFIFSAFRSPSKIERSFFMKDKNSLEMNFKNFALSRSQDIKDSYFDAAQFYWGSNNSWKNKKNILNSSSKFIEIPGWRAIDIDTKEDWKKAELMNKYIKNINF